MQGRYATPRAVMDSGFTLYFRLECLVLLEEEGLDLDEFRDVLIEFYGSEHFAKHVSYFRKALSRYDRLRARANLFSSTAGDA